jgi:hypothetical protein
LPAWRRWQRLGERSDRVAVPAGLVVSVPRALNTAAKANMLLSVMIMGTGRSHQMIAEAKSPAMRTTARSGSSSFS